MIQADSESDIMGLLCLLLLHHTAGPPAWAAAAAASSQRRAAAAAQPDEAFGGAGEKGTGPQGARRAQDFAAAGTQRTWCCLADFVQDDASYRCKLY
jgi:hypothetical protein